MHQYIQNRWTDLERLWKFAAARTQGRVLVTWVGAGYFVTVSR